MQRKPGFPVANCSIKMPDCSALPDSTHYEDDSEQQQRRQQLINFGHSQWGFNNWSWSVTKQELDFVDFTNGKYCAGVVAFVSITVKSFDIHRENIGYATSMANTKGFAIYKSRKCAVTNALRETLLSFGGSVASDLIEILETLPANAPERLAENNPNIANKDAGPTMASAAPAARKEPEPARAAPKDVVPPVAHAGSPAAPLGPPPTVKNAPPRPLPTTLPPANRLSSAPRPAAPPPPVAPPAPPLARHNSNEAPAKSTNTFEGMTEEEARAERKRRQKLAQEEFRQKQLAKQQIDEKQDLGRNSSSFDHLLMEIPTQDIMIEATGEEPGKRKSPGPESTAAKRRNSCRSKLDIVQTD